MVVAASGSVHVWHDPPPSNRPNRPHQTEAVTPLPAETPPDLPGAKDVPDNALLAAIVTIALGLVIAMIIYAVISTWLGRVRTRRKPPPAAPDHVVVLPAVTVADVVLDEESQLEALAHGEPRNAIVACWLRVEDDVAKAGLPRHAAETSTEFTQRVLASSLFDAAPVIELAALYREARFSRHRMGQPERDCAMVALRQIHAALAPVGQA